MNQPAHSAIDELNQSTIRASVLEYEAIVGEGLNAQERAALQCVAGGLRGARILDIGMGAGRTVTALRALGETYVGVDYVQEMVDHCRRQFPGVRFERADARAMPQFADGSFDLVVFSCNGICMVDHAGRLAILSEVRRLLSPQGVFIFSTCNRNSPQFEAFFRFPDFARTRNPARWLVRAGRFSLQTLRRLSNRWKYRRHEIHKREYAVLNDVCHHYQTMLYFIGVREQWRQLAQAGFGPAGPVLDLEGRPTGPECRDGTLAFVARKL